jgi:hypothetical protein
VVEYETRDFSFHRSIPHFVLTNIVYLVLQVFSQALKVIAEKIVKACVFTASPQKAEQNHDIKGILQSLKKRYNFSHIWK